MSDKPDFLYPSRRHALDRSLSARIRRAVLWRARAAAGRIPPLARMIREIRAVTGRGRLAIGADLVTAWVFARIHPTSFVGNLLWEVPKESWPDFVSSREAEVFCAATVDPSERVLIRDKVAFADHDRRRGMPWPPALAVINRGEGPSIENARVVSDEHHLATTLEELARDGDLFLKPSCAKQGRGAYRYQRGGNACDGDGNSIALDALARDVFDYRHPEGAFGYVVQPMLSAHPAIVEITGSSVLSTVRIVTAVREGATHVLQSILKIPSPERITDNFHGGLTGTMVAGIDPATGRLRDLVGLLRPGNTLVCERTGTHPRTGRRIAGEELPLWRDAFELARSAALLHPRAATLGWDIGLTPSGWVFLDVNVMWGPAGSQVCMGEGMRPTMARIFPESW
jgi:hypothetical protein